MRSKRLMATAIVLVVFLSLEHVPEKAAAQGGDTTVRGSVTITGGRGVPADRGGVVIWLTQGDSSGRRQVAGGDRPRFRIVQKGKTFLPRVLVVPTGAVVDFPNFDPVFHNVFSLFEGKRFDLGLYEAGRSRSVTFARPGVSHVFCNIHPDMSAVVVAVDSDHYGTTSASGAFALANVPPGRYQLHVWHDRFKADPGEYPKDVVVSSDGSTLSALSLVDSGRTLTTHTNKFGHPYVPPNATSPIYR